MSSLLQKVGVDLPIIQAPMAGTSTPALAAAVSRSGALGSIAVGAMTASAADAAIEATQSMTRKAINVNVFAHRPAAADCKREQAWLDGLRPFFARYGAEPPDSLREIYTSYLADPDLETVLVEKRPEVVSLHFGLPPAASVARLQAAGIVVFACVTNLEEAAQAQAVGVDALVAQGFEAGGHRGVFDPTAADSELGLIPLVRLLVNNFSLPVIAAGGIMDGAGIAAVLDLGAVAAQLGTAFVGCPESSADEYHRAALRGPGAAATMMTRTISGRPARCLPNLFTSLIDSELKGLASPDYPIAYDAGKALAAAARAKDEGGFGAQWAGQGAPLARAMPAAELVAVLVEEMTAARSRVRPARA